MNIYTVKQKTTPATTPKFSIMIPSWNNLPYLRLCIESIRKNSHYQHEIIVHINEGVDGSLTWIQSQADISYSHSQENIGVCYALNSCRTLATTDYLVYLNDDMYVCPDWDLALVEEIDQLTDPYFFFSATAIETRKQSNCSIEKTYGTHPDNFQEEKLLAEYRQLPMEDWQGATWPPNVVHKDVWDLVGGYSIEYSPGMYSDPDFSYKLWKLGVRLFKGIAKSRVYHFGSVSVKRIKKNDGYYMFIAKWGMTSGTFSKYFLRRGERFDGPLEERPIPFLTRIKNHLKAQVSVLHK
ncbi:MAG: glycosyltransferase [Bacteroidota bacterium]|nr:glycosyltransferase [Bacteroidota bacterium]